MRVTGEIHAFDLGQRTGFCFGAPGPKPRRSGAVVLKRKHEAQAVAFGNFIYFLEEEWRRGAPEMIVAEEALSLAAMNRMDASQAVVDMHYGLHAILRGMAHRFGRTVMNSHPGTVRKHFLGMGRVPGGRDETKAALVARCHLVKLMPRDSNDDDRADAISIWDWAASTYGQRSATMTELFLIGEKPR